MRRTAIILLLVLLAGLAGCGGGSSPSPELAGARERTASEGTATFALLIDALVGGAKVRSSEMGSLSFGTQRAHLYKLVPGQSLPQELVLIGPVTYTNANVEAALHDRTVKPWTKLDTRRLSAKHRASYGDELAHVRALVHLADGVDTPTRIGVETVDGERFTRVRGLVDPKQVVARAPDAQRRSIAGAVRNDYPAQPFNADFWLDEAGRIGRVLVAYRTNGGTQIALDGRFSEFGGEVDVTVPSADSIEDISP